MSLYNAISANKQAQIGKNRSQNGIEGVDSLNQLSILSSTAVSGGPAFSAPAYGAPAVDWAVFYAEMFGWHVFPVAIYTDRVTGKVNKIPGLNKEVIDTYFIGSRWGCSNDPATIRKAFKIAADARKKKALANPITGIGLALQESRLMVVDKDTVEGGHAADGFIGFKVLEDRHGKLPLTVTGISPSGSTHEYFTLVDGVKPSSGGIAPGVDIPGFVVLPGSIRPDGCHEWTPGCAPWERDIAGAPDWFIHRAMFHREEDQKFLDNDNRRQKLAALPQNQWRAQFETWQREADDERQRNAKVMRLRHKADAFQPAGYIGKDERENIDLMTRNMIDDACNELTGLPSIGGRNNQLMRSSFKVGVLVGHPETAGAVSESAAINMLMNATDGWGKRHPASRRSQTIKHNIAQGVAVGAARGDQGNWVGKAVEAVRRRSVGTVEGCEGGPGDNVVSDRLDIEQAWKKTSDEIGEWFKNAKRWYEDRNSFGSKSIDIQRGVIHGVQAGTGLGKTESLIDWIIKHHFEIRSNTEDVISVDGKSEFILRHGFYVFCATRKQQVELEKRFSDELERRHREDPENIPLLSVGAISGRGALIDPNYPSKGKFCKIDKLTAVAAEKNQPVSEICKECPFADVCAYKRQSRSFDITIFSHGHLSVEETVSQFGYPWAQAIDESVELIHSPAKRGIETGGSFILWNDFRSAPDLRRKDERLSYDASNDIFELRKKLGEATANGAGDYMTVAALTAAGITETQANEGVKLERWAWRQQAPILPSSYENPDPAQYLEDIENISDKAEIFLSAWHSIKDLFARNKAANSCCSPGGMHKLPGDHTIELYCDNDGNLLLASWNSLAKTLKHKTPTLLIDATMPLRENQDPLFHFGVVRGGVIAAKKPHQTTVGVFGAPATKTAMGRASAIRQHALSIMADMNRHDIQADDVLVITMKEFKSKLRNALPGIAVENYGALQGIDKYGDVKAMYLVGVPLMSTDAGKAIAEMLQHSKIEDDAGHMHRANRTIETRDGRRFAVSEAANSCDLVHRVMINSRDSQVLQGEGRGRGGSPKRADNPLRMVIIGDMVLPLEYDDVMDWKDFRANPADVITAAGLMPGSGRLALTLFRQAFGAGRVCGDKVGEREAIQLFGNGLESDSQIPQSLFNIYNNIGFAESVNHFHGTARIRLAGSGGNWSPIRYDSDRIPDLAAYIHHLTGKAIEILGDHPDTVRRCLDAYGFVPTSIGHAHKLAPHIWSTRNAAIRPLENLTPAAGENEIGYRLPGPGQQWTKAICRADTVEEGRRIIRGAWPQALFYDG